MRRMSFDPRRLLEIPKLFLASQRSVRKDGTLQRIVSEIVRIEPGQRVLDVGCGPASILSYMPAGVEYFGFDLSPKYIEAARHRFGTRGRFYIREVSEQATSDLGRFDVVMALAVVHHLNDGQAHNLFRSAHAVLKPNGRIVTLDGAYVDGQNPIARILLRLDRGRYVRTPQAYLAIASQHFPDAHARIFHDLLAVPYTHCVIESRRADQN